jgi:hypothetical protein
MQRPENKGDKSVAPAFGRAVGAFGLAFFTARVNACPSAVVAGFYGRHEVVKFHGIPYRRYQDIPYTLEQFPCCCGVEDLSRRRFP